MAITVIGIGNILRGDDAIGPVMLSELAKVKLPEVELIDVGTDAFTVLEYFLKNEPLIIVDCVKMNKTPGEVTTFKLNMTNIEQASSLISLHGISLAEIFKMAQALGSVTECIFIGVEPESLEFNKDLSKKVRESIPLITKIVIEEINKYGKKSINH